MVRRTPPLHLVQLCCDHCLERAMAGRQGEAVPKVCQLFDTSYLVPGLSIVAVRDLICSQYFWGLP